MQTFQLRFLPDFRQPKTSICFAESLTIGYAMNKATPAENEPCVRFAEVRLYRKDGRRQKLLCSYPCAASRFNKLMQLPH
jgi:hypothetical protein